jgi:hypothetical protein
MLATAISLAAFAGLALGWSADRLVRRNPKRRFAREFAALVADTPIDWDALQGPGPDGVGAEAAGNAAAAGTDPADARASATRAALAQSFAAPASHAEDLSARAKALSADDLEYFATSWRNIRGQFMKYPVSALRLARHVTANLMLNRGLVPADTARPSELPEGWTFPTARGYREALCITATADGENPLSEGELTRALNLFEDFYWEILALDPVAY